MKKETELAKLKRWFEEEVKRKDEIIEKLKKENIVLLKTALKQGSKLTNFESRLKELTKKK
jgi:hypothetical protein